MPDKINLAADDVLLLVDIQNDFCPGGALAVPDGDAIIASANLLIDLFTHVIVTQDWHPADHFSFAGSHPGKQPYDTIEATYGTQILWPSHCVQQTNGALLHPQLQAGKSELILRKGYHREIDSYSAFFENDRITATGLAGYLQERNLRRIFMAGLATDFCVAYSACDARRLGFEVFVIEDACRAIDLDQSLAAAWQNMRASGVKRVTTGDIKNF